MITAHTVLCLCFAGFVHGFTGFGYAMVAMALLPLFMDMPQALFLGAFFTLPAAINLFWRHRRYYAARDGWPLVAGAAAGTPVGLLLVERLDPLLLIHLLGAILVLFSVNELLLTRLWKVPVPTWLGLPFGLACGILGAAFNIGGPPAIIYVYAQPWKREQAIATLQAMFFFNSGLRILLTLPTGIVTPDMAILCAWAIVPFVVISIAGAHLAARIPPHRFKQIVLVALIGMGSHYMLM